ncbi:MAG: hypothetical protein J5I59_08125 [Saprospiraceae bacterium]|nr:hypothetical protein [Saprospiraceae bacterium]
MVINNFKTVALMALAIFAISFTSCKDDEPELPKIDGYNNSNEIAATNLKAHWSFDGSDKEDISNTTSSNTVGTVSFVTGQIGQAISLTNAAVVYPAIDAINQKDGFGDYTISMWINAKNVGKFQQYFGLFPTANTDFWGNFSVGAEASRHAAASDTLEIKTNYASLKEDGNINGQDNLAVKNGDVGNYFLGAGKWSNIVVRFTAATHKLEIFANGVNVGGYSDRGENTTAMVMRTPCQAVLGSFATSDLGFASAPAAPDWFAKATAQIDDIRLFNKSITDTEIKALYNVGLAGR